jgi:DNA-binding LacI/PurR family transcriptional regulator
VTTRRGTAPTLETVAAAAGVSRATVSRVVNGDPRVDAALRDRVRAAVAASGYVPNRAARSLVTRRTDSIAWVVREPVEVGLADPYLSSLLVAASQHLAGRGVQLPVMMAASEDDSERLAAYVRGGHVDGAILTSLHASDPLPGQLLEARVPFVVGGRPPRDLAGQTWVDVDNRDAAVVVAARMLARGRRRLAVVAGRPDMTASVDRVDGFLAGAREHGVDGLPVRDGGFTSRGGEQAARELLAHDPGLDAIFAANDLMAAGALRVLRALGRRVGEDVDVVGFDDVSLAAETDPPLTTVRQPVARAAAAMVDGVLAQLDGRGLPDPVVLPTELVVRASG